MLVVSAFTFFGLSAIQNVSYFTDFFGGVKISINITAQEEENETSSNNEVKEVKHPTNTRLSNNEQINLSNAKSLLAFQRNASKHSVVFIEVSTPPPEFIS